MSVAKPFVFALVCDAIGTDRVRDGSGRCDRACRSTRWLPIERHGDGTTNPMVNAGAIATAGLVPGRTVEERWPFVRAGMSQFAGRPLALDEEVYRSASASNARNRAIVQLLESVGRVDGDPARCSTCTPARAACASRRSTSR